VVCAWEIAIKTAAGRLQLSDAPSSWFEQVIDRYELLLLSLDLQTACAAAALPRVHGDPFDRVLVALAQARGLTVLTSDKHIGQYPGVAIIW
jgi:PIN domain nuclease of toxin-antitoxin system